MSLKNQLAALYGIKRDAEEVITHTADGTVVVLRWCPDEQWLLWKWRGEGYKFRPLSFTSVRRIAKAFVSSSTEYLDFWERSAYDALRAAGLDELDIDYSYRDDFGNRTT